MEKIKTILDREPLSSDYIASKQDFANVVNGAKGLAKPYWKTNWFAGAVSVAAVAIIVTAVTLNSSEDPVKEPGNQAIVAAITEDSVENPIVEEQSNSIEDVSDKEIVDAANVEESATDAAEQQETPKRKEQEADDSENTTQARQKPEEVDVKAEEIAMPNIAGVTEGTISFNDFCDPLGIQVGNGILIHQYTIQYRSCARDITYRIRGNMLPQSLCKEIADCGSPIEVTFSNFKAQNRNGDPVKLQSFSLVTSPKY